MLLKEARSCISLLDRNCHLFVKVLLIQKWPSRSVELVEEYQGFLLDLCSAHSYYTELAINQLTQLFLPDAFEDPEWINGEPTEEDKLAFSRVHNVLKILLRVIPMSSELFFSSLTKNFPYHGNGSHVHECYVYNLLTILQYQSSMRRDILNLIISR
ncbi:hypothetical protein LSTR_LSTR016611 [Laodelphax striatellus]|uniref:Uncharacterized protein n=1 Tax=Laodelphax striatellus TaxID=195883 RepID=A0A482XGA2_LAOST|nr:hypothetical protein LSTR_LSTR016611 [Laodelphax striatellus]